MGGPRIGDVTPEWLEGRCAYGDDEHAVACLREATWHGISGDLRGMLSCDLHRPIVAALSHWIHAADIACIVPEGHFLTLENRCHLPWQTGRTECDERSTASLGAATPCTAAPTKLG